MKTILLYEKRYLYRGWLCRPLIVFCVTVFPSARARHSVPLGRVARFITARAFTLSVPSLHSVPLGRGAVAPLKVRSPKSAVFGGGYFHFFISLQRLLSLKCKLISSYLRRLRLAHARLRERARLSKGNAWHLPRFIYTSLYLRKNFNHKSARCFFAILWGRVITFAIKPNKCKCACGTFAHG